MLTRRLLMGSALSSLTLPVVGRAEFPARFIVLVFRDFSPHIPYNALYEFIAPFLQARIPIGFTILAQDWKDCSDESCAEIWKFLHRAATEYPGFISLIPEISSDQNDSPYFQARKVFDFGRTLNSLKQYTNTLTSAHRYISAITADDGPEGNPSGYRIAGMRNIITPQSVATESASGFENGVHKIPGTVLASTDTLIQSIRAVDLSSSVGQALIFPAQYTDGISPGDMKQQAERIIQAYRQHFFERGIQASLPSDIHLHLRPDYAQRIFFFSGENQQVSQILTDLNTPFHSHITAVELLTHTPGTSDQRKALAAYQARELLQVLQTSGDADVCGISPEGQPGFSTRLIATEENLADLDRLAGEKSDYIIDLSAVWAGPATDQKLRQSVTRITSHPTRFIVAPDQLADTLLPNDPVYAAFRDEVLFREHVNKVTSQSAEGERSRLMRDAQTAWRYFSTWEHPRTGLCPTTVFHAEERSYLHQKATLWDIGSLLFALLSGERMGLISRNDVALRAGKIIGSIPTITVAGLRLPASLISTTTGRALKQEFNSCDCARLFSAFSHLMQWDELQPAIAAKHANWDLAGTIRENQPHNIDADGFHSTYHSHCTHYSSLAFAQFGFQHDSPYRSQHQDASDADQKMHLLNRCSFIGLVGAEPLLFEPLEFGEDPINSYLADVLLTQHWLHYQKTGQLTAVSEAPVNKSPWFIYEGLNFLDPDTRWNIALVQKSSEFSEEDLRNELSMLNTKAAFLWAATHPGDYTQKLVDRIRRNVPENATGFPPGVYHHTETSDSDFTDINTNAVILQAIAHQLYQ